MGSAPGRSQGRQRPAGPAVVFGVAAVGALGSYLQTNQGILLAEEGIDPLPTIDYLKGRVTMLVPAHGRQNSLLTDLVHREKALGARNATTRRDAPNHITAFSREARRRIGIRAARKLATRT